MTELTFAGHDGPLPEQLVASCERFGHLMATLITNKDVYSDFFKVLRRRESMTMAGELLWELVPPQVLATDAFVLAALLEPCTTSAATPTTYAINENGVLHFAVFDAMGHGLTAAGVAAFALSVCRHSRRRSEGPTATCTAIDAAVYEQYPTSRFVTALIAELDVGSGRLRWISAGHPAPMLLRRGQLIKALDVAPSPPMGMRLTTSTPVEGDESLERGDMVGRRSRLQVAAG